MPIPQGRSAWENLATDALAALLEQRGALVRAEAEALLSEGGWITRYLRPDLSDVYGPQPHHITVAFRRLVETGKLEEQSAVLQGHSVSVWIDRGALDSRGRATAVLDAAARKRRLYRSYLSWAMNPQLCGSIAELVVHAAIGRHAGERLWLPPSIQPGRVSAIAGRPITVGGPLDAAGYWAVDPENPAAGTIPFAVEVKNVRSWLYPWDHETWDLLAKLAAFPDVVPVLVARRIHPITFKLFADIGVLGHQTKRQWFHNAATTRSSIDLERFERVKTEFGFHDAELIELPAVPPATLARFFGETAYKVMGQETTVATRSLERWSEAAPIAERFGELRVEDLPMAIRARLWAQFCGEIEAAGLYNRRGWAPEHFDAE